MTTKRIINPRNGESYIIKEKGKQFIDVYPHAPYSVNILQDFIRDEFGLQVFEGMQPNVVKQDKTRPLKEKFLRMDRRIMTLKKDNFSLKKRVARTRLLLWVSLATIGVLSLALLMSVLSR